MKFPRLFVQNGLQARKDAIEVLNKYFKLLNVKDYCNVMDVGCGPGNVSHDLLYPLLPNTTKKFIGIDISPKMIEFANHNYRKSSKIKFSVMDIVTDNIPENYKAEFDHIISLYCLHFVNDHRKALLNMHTMLKPGGNVLLNFMANRVFMDIYKRMAEMTEWKIHFQKLKEIEPPTEYCDNSKIYYEGLLREIGFEPHLCFETKKIYVYSEKLFANTVIAVSFFDIPKDLEDKFVLDHKECMNNFNLVHTDENNNMYFHTTYTLLTIYASKSK